MSSNIKDILQSVLYKTIKSDALIIILGKDINKYINKSYMEILSTKVNYFINKK